MPRSWSPCGQQPEREAGAALSGEHGQRFPGFSREWAAAREGQGEGEPAGVSCPGPLLPHATGDCSDPGAVVGEGQGTGLGDEGSDLPAHPSPVQGAREGLAPLLAQCPGEAQRGASGRRVGQPRAAQGCWGQRLAPGGRAWRGASTGHRGPQGWPRAGGMARAESGSGHAGHWGQLKVFVTVVRARGSFWGVGAG